MSKKKRVLIIAGSLFVVFLLFFIFGTPEYREMKIKNEDFSTLETRLKDACTTKDVVNIAEEANFSWDECYVFPPYYPSEEVYKSVGKEWTSAKTFIEYVMFHNMENEVHSEGQYLIVFKSNGKVVLSTIYNLRDMPIVFNLKDNKFTKDKAKFSIKSSDKYGVSEVKELTPVS